MRFFRSLAAAAVLLLSSAAPVLAWSDPAPTSNWQAEVDRVVRAVLASTGVPSASIAVVKDGRIAYVRAYGDAALQPRNPARPAMRYAIGSISKQFTAAAILLLAQDHKLSLDDPVGRFLPGLTRGDEVTVRQLLSHTSGYQDFWPQDYVPPFMLQDITAQAILDRWARKPLDFEPGTQYQYSNTGYTAAGLIVEKAGGVALMRLLRERVFGPLKMTSVFNVDESRLPESDPTGYIRYGLGPLRMAPKEGKGWLFAAGELAMTAEDLARWNISVIDQSLLAPASYAEMQTEVRLKNGLGIQYGLGLGVTSRSGHRGLAHGGEVSGFTANNLILPDDRAAVSVLTNQDAVEASSEIAAKIARIAVAPDSSAAEKRARAVFEGLQRGKLDRSQLTANAGSYFTEQAMRDLAASLAPLGKPTQFKQTDERDRGGMKFRNFEVKFAKRTLQVWERDMPDGKIEQYQVMARD